MDIYMDIHGIQAYMEVFGLRHMWKYMDKPVYQ